MTRMKQPNISPAFIGSYYVDEENKVFQLDSCEFEPAATFVGSDGIKINKPISCFANLTRLKPIHELVKTPGPRKVRADKGIQRKPKEQQEIKNKEETAPW